MKEILKYWRRTFTVLCAGAVLLMLLIYFVAGEDISVRKQVTSAVTPQAATQEIIDGVVLEQSFVALDEQLSKISLLCGDFGRVNTGVLHLGLYASEGGELLAQTQLPMADVKGDAYQHWVMDPALSLNANEEYILRIEAPGTPEGQGVGIIYGSGFSNGKYTIDLSGNAYFWINGQQQNGVVCFEAEYEKLLFTPAQYWLFCGAAFVVVLLYCLRLCWKQKRNRPSRTLRMMTEVYRARFLLKQLVSRDFKNKYKRSYLGVMWSLLNPMMTMLVQYLVFGTLFKSSVENFAVYLMVGIVTWNFFGETTALGLSSITSNFSLISKVYVPKYVFPLSKLLCSCINFVLSLIPLSIFVLASGLPVTKAYLLLPLVFVMLFLFCYGMSLLLATCMVFFRDTQFLWSVVSLLWMYITPIFYPDSIIPAAFLSIYRMNPMYQFITFIRAVLIDGASPDILSYLLCAAWAIGTMLVGLGVFKKNEDKFVFYI